MSEMELSYILFLEQGPLCIRNVNYYINLTESSYRNMYERFIFIFIILTELMKNGDGFCAISLKSMKFVNSCPSSKEEMEKSSRRKNCSQYINQDAERTCTDYKKIKYHCVINDSGNQTIEVCAPERVIKGFCAEFLIENGKIQGHTYLDCTRYSSPCPGFYKSSETYKYQECYNLRNNVKLIQDYQRPVTLISKPASERPALTSKESLATPTQPSVQDWVLVGISIVILISIAALFVVLCICKLPRYCVKKPNPGGQNREEAGCGIPLTQQVVQHEESQ